MESTRGFLDSLTAYDGMVLCGITKLKPISLHRLFYELQTLENR
jgi:hypothetical protein